MADELLYFDNNATSALDPAALEAMLPWLREDYGNPSSSHDFGQRAAAAVAKARGQVARLIGAKSPAEIVFTAGGTESLNTAIHSAIAGGPAERPGLLTSAAEHSAVEKPLAHLATRGFELERIGLDRDGRLDTDSLLARIDSSTRLVALLWANNETGVVLPRADIVRIGEACRAAGATFLLDGVQAAGKLTLDLRELPVDLVSLSGHKLHGPKGSGALWVRSGFELEPLLRGGPQEGDRRAGTENVPAIVGLGAACALASSCLEDGVTLARVAEARDLLEQGLREVGAEIVGAGAERVANTTNALFRGISGEALLLLLSEEGLAVSTGSACDSAHAAPSHVIQAMGYSAQEAGSTLRFSLSRRTRPEEVERALEITARSAEILRQLAPN